MEQTEKLCYNHRNRWGYAQMFQDEEAAVKKQRHGVTASWRWKFPVGSSPAAACIVVILTAYHPDR